MRRKDREISDIQEALEIISECPILRIGLSDDDFPYVVPLNFGYEMTDDTIVFYIHGSSSGRKAELLNREQKCFVELDSFVKISPQGSSATTLYSSFMANATARKLEGEEKLHGLKVLLDRYDETRGMDPSVCSNEYVSCFELKVISWSCKANGRNNG